MSSATHATAPQDLSQALAAEVREAAGNGRPLVITGSASKRFLGRDVAGTPLDVAGHTGIIAYHPEELVITARAGTSLEALTATLGERGQWLPFDPPRFGGGGTLGGAISTGLSGPSRPFLGAARDFVLGVRLINGRGQILRFGGEVMKNVAGYDVSRLLTGAFGTLGVLLDVSLKVLPAPRVTRTLTLACDAREAVSLFATLRARPLPLTGAAWIPEPAASAGDATGSGTASATANGSATANATAAASDTGSAAGTAAAGAATTTTASAQGTAPRTTTGTAGEVRLRLAGSAAGVEAAVRALRTEFGAVAADDATDATFWQQLRDHDLPFFRNGAGDDLYRLSVPPASRPLGLAASCLIDWAGGQRWVRGALDAEAVRTEARALGGHATRFRRAAASSDDTTPARAAAAAAGAARRGSPEKDDLVFHPLTPAVMAAHRRLKAAFDPHHILNPGRMYPGV